MKRSPRNSPGRGGFTLIELLVVLAILVMLVAMVAPKILGRRKEADINTAKSQIGLLKGALEQYVLDCRDYPSTEQGLQALITMPGVSDTMGGSGEMGGGGDLQGWKGPYINSDALPADPWGMAYQYEYPPTRGAGPGPDIWSMGKDRQDGTEDDIVSWNVAASGEGGATGQDEFGQQQPATMPPEGLQGPLPPGAAGAGGRPPMGRPPAMPPAPAGRAPAGGGLPPARSVPPAAPRTR